MAELTPRMKELVQPYLAGIEPYDPNFTPTRINLSANENTYPVPAGVCEAIDAALAATPLNRYPDPMSNDLRDELAAWRGVTRENISYYDLGYKTGEMAYEILVNGANVSTMPIAFAPQFTKKYNAAICEALGITVPDDYVPMD